MKNASKVGWDGSWTRIIGYKGKGPGMSPRVIIDYRIQPEFMIGLQVEGDTVRVRYKKPAGVSMNLYISANDSLSAAADAAFDAVGTHNQYWNLRSCSNLPRGGFTITLDGNAKRDGSGGIPGN